MQDTTVRAFNWSVLLVLLATVLYCFANFTTTIPLTEDWFVIKAVTGGEPNLAHWIWSQVAEHRVPLPKVLLYSLLAASRANVRAGMLANIALLTLSAVFLIAAARRARGGFSRYADIFPALVFLNVGQWANMFWAWQLTFTTGVFFAVLAIAIVFCDPLFKRAFSTAAFAVSLICLPLCGATGLLYVPGPLLWAAYRGYTMRATPERRKGIALILSALCSVFLCALYFAGYESPDWSSGRPTVMGGLWGAAQVTTFGFGPVTRNLWALSVTATLLLIGATATMLVRAISRSRNVESLRVVSISLIYVALVGYALVLGWSRAMTVKTVYKVWPFHYIVLIAPLTCFIYLIWDTCAGTKARRIVQYGLVTVMILLFPLNYAHGRRWGNQFLIGHKSVTADILAGMPAEQLAVKHRATLHHAMPSEELIPAMIGLKKLGRWPFSGLRENASLSSNAAPDSGNSAILEQCCVPAHIEYLLPGADEAKLAWGVNGWHKPSLKELPEGTIWSGRTLESPMKPAGAGRFKADVSLPGGTKLNFGFFSRSRIDRSAPPIWEGDYEQLPGTSISIASHLRFGSDGAPAYVTPGNLVSRTIRYHSPAAGQVFLNWGIHGWYPVARASRPAGTEVIRNSMVTPMLKTGNAFTATILIPPDAGVDCGFTITRSKLFDLSEPLWDDKAGCTSSKPMQQQMDLQAGVEVVDNLLTFSPSKLNLLAAVIAVLILWAALGVALRLIGGIPAAGRKLASQALVAHSR